MSIRVYRQLSLVALATLVAAPGIASVISLNMEFSASYRPDVISLTAVVKNLGDEPAHAVVIEGRIDGRRAVTDAYEQLDPTRECEVQLDLGPSPLPKGVYTVAVTVHYEDANGYPYSDVRMVPVITDPDAMEREPLTCVLAEDATGLDITATVASQHPDALPCHIRFVVPAEVTVSPETQALALTPRGCADVTAHLTPTNALAGESRFIIAIVDAVIDGLHYSTQAVHLQTFPTPRNVGLRVHRAACASGIVLLAAWAVLVAVPPLRRSRCTGALGTHAAHRLVLCGILTASVGLFLWHIPLSLILTDTIITGGDIPAHTYLAKRLAHLLFAHGRVVGWAAGWWCGFPMFQFYFPLPYILIALLDMLVPFNIAFRLVYVAGMVSLPFAAWGAGRIARLPRPVPALLGLAATVVLYDASHTMWGVNIYSTLAGMIANSMSFPIMLLFVASAARDAQIGTFRLRTVALLVLLYLSHFFTTVMGILLVAAIPILLPRGTRWRGFRTLAAEGALGTLMMGWWLVPLLAKRQYAMDFGVNWDVNLLTQMPAAYWAAAPWALYAAVVGARRRTLAVNLLTLMLAAGVLLFYVGFALSPVFINIRLWPFITFALLSLGATGLGLALQRAPAAPLAVAAVTVLSLTCAVPYPDNIRSWADWNFSGMEAKPNWEVFEKLVLPLDGTPGRLANDLHDANASLGSSRAFEAVPFMIDKPILEGGLVNSAAGSMFAYYIQSETSRSCAGFPTIVHPTTFTPDVAFRHLRLFGVKHFIAKSAATREAFRRAENWRLVRACRGWELFEDTAQDGALVTVLPRMPLAVATADWKQAGLDWMYTPATLDQHFVLLRPGQNDVRFCAPLDEVTYAAYLNARRAGGAGPSQGYRVSAAPGTITSQEVTDERIRFTTKGIGLPHLIKATWYPNWQVRGASGVYQVTPCFMLVFPEQEDVELTYGTTRSDVAGQAASVLGLLIIGSLIWKRCHHHESHLAA